MKFELFASLVEVLCLWLLLKPLGMCCFLCTIYFVLFDRLVWYRFYSIQLAGPKQLGLSLS